MNSYREKKERERVFFSSTIVFGSTLLIFLILFLFNLLKFEDFQEYTGPVKITFGSPDSLIENTDLKNNEIKKPLAEEVVPVKEVVKESIPEIKNDIKESKSDEVKVDQPKIVDTKNVSSVPKVEPKPVEPDKPVVQKGRESGNSHETSFETNSSKIGRSVYFPIYQFMPLPKKITLDIFSLINGDITGQDEKNYNRNLFKKYYFDRGSFFSLTDTVPLDERPYLWAILEDAGYNVNKAEYKVENKLKPIIISFEINNNSGGKNAVILSAKIESSSGNNEIDESVLYGFKQSTYSNTTDEKVKGRFKYSFD